MQLKWHYCWIKPSHSLCNWFLSGLIRTIPKVTQGNFPNLCGNMPSILTISSKQFYLSANSLSDKNKQFRNAVQHNDFKVQSLWEVEENEKVPSKFESDVKYVVRGAKAASDRQGELLTNKLKAEVHKVKHITNENWEAIKTSVLETQGSINEGNIDAIIINKCAELSLSLGKSYFKFLKSTQKRMNRATYGNYLRLFYLCSSDCTDNDFKEILQIYKELLDVYPILDSYTAEKVVLALCLTKNWKEYDKLFKDIKQFYFPTAQVYSVVIQTSFKNEEFDLGWALIEEMKLNNAKVPDDVFICWLERNKSDKDLRRVLDFLSKFNLKPSFELCGIIKQSFEDIGVQRKGTFSTILNRGVCKNCNAKLEPAWVSQDDYDQLKTAFLNPVLIGKDIFQKTQPEEFNTFLKFLEKTAPYDVVLDGLNIAMKAHKSIRSPKVFAFQLKSVVKHFATQGQKVLVFGRKHMAKWPREDLQYINANAHVFLAEDISQDDPFMLYATLYSGLGTRFVSQDLMRGHKFLLADPKLQVTFQKWQAQHQHFIKYIENNGLVHMKDPVQFMQSIQQNSWGDWHIPYEVKEDLPNWSQKDNYHKYWLCLKNRPLQQPETKQYYNYQRAPASQNRKMWDEKSVRREVPRFKPLK